MVARREGAILGARCSRACELKGVDAQYRTLLTSPQYSVSFLRQFPLSKKSSKQNFQAFLIIFQALDLEMPWDEDYFIAVPANNN